VRHHEDPRVGQDLLWGGPRDRRLGDRITPPFHGRYLAAHIAGARYFEQPGDHSLRFAGSGDNDALFREIAEFLASVGGDPSSSMTESGDQRQN
jgi:hypothetical protein